MNDTEKIGPHGNHIAGPGRQATINLVYKNFRDAGDDPENAIMRLELLNAGTDELEVAVDAYGD